jgi:hypothetical protein
LRDVRRILALFSVDELTSTVSSREIENIEKVIIKI